MTTDTIHTNYYYILECDGETCLATAIIDGSIADALEYVKVENPYPELIHIKGLLWDIDTSLKAGIEATMNYKTIPVLNECLITFFKHTATKYPHSTFNNS